MSEAKKIILATFTDIIVMRLGDNGYDEFVPGSVSFNVMPNNDYKVWIIARAKNNGNLILNAIVPKNMAITLSSKEKMVVSCGKVPSTTYIDEMTGKSIPTLWKFCMPSLEDRERFVFLLNAARKRFDVPIVETTTKITKTKNVLQMKNAAAGKNKKKITVVKRAPIKRTYPTKASKNKHSLSIDVTPAEKENKVTRDNENENDDDDLGSIGDSPQFAQSQDVYASLSRWESDNDY